MHNKLDTISRFFSKVFSLGAGFSIFSVFMIVFINSTRRYTVGKSLEWGEELPVYLAIYGVMFGIAWAYMEDRHVRFTMLVGFLPESMTRKLYLFVDLIMIGTGVLLTYSGYLFMMKRGNVEASGIVNLAKDLNAMTGWEGIMVLGQMYPYYAATVVGGVLLVIAATLRFLQRLNDDVPQKTVAEA